MATLIWPSHNDVGSADGDGRVMTEDRWVEALHEIAGGRSGFLSGGAFSDTGLDFELGAFTALIHGQYVETDAALSVTLPASSSRYVFARVTRDAHDRADGVELYASTSETPPDSDFILAASVTTDGSSVTTALDVRQNAQGLIVGSFLGNGGVSRKITTGRTPSMVMLASAGASGTNNIFACSVIGAPGYRPSLDGSSIPQARWYGYTGSTRDLASILSGSASWTVSLGSGAGDVKDVTVTGAAAGDSAMAHFAADADNAALSIVCKVTGADTVRVWIRNISGGAYSLSSSTVYVRVAHAYTDTWGNFVFLQNSVGDTKSPMIEAGGFTVSAGTNPTLNLSGRRYNYVAIF